MFKRRRGAERRNPAQPVRPSTARPLSRRLAQQRDEILQRVIDPGVPSRRFDVVGDVGSGKSALLQEIAERCRARGLLVLHATAPRVTSVAEDSTQAGEMADLRACSDLIASFISSIDTFRFQHPESRAATSRAINDLGRIRSPQRLHHLVYATTNIAINDSEDLRGIGNVTVNAGPDQRLHMLQGETESVLHSLVRTFPLAMLIDDVHLLEGTSVQDWLHALLRRVPTLCTVTTRRPASDGWQLGHTHEDQTVELVDMTLEEVVEYLRDRQLTFTEAEARELFNRTRGHGFALATWCDLALDGAGVGGIAELMDHTGQAANPGGFTSLTERVREAVDQIPVDMVGRRMPLFALATVAEAVTPDLIAMLESDTGVTLSAIQAKELYRRLASRRFISAVDGNVEKGVYLSRAISEPSGRQLLEHDPVVFRKMHSYVERHYRDLVDLDAEHHEKTPFAAWSRFEDPVWVRDVERWLNHSAWLDRRQFEAMKPALAKIYLDAFWWWDDYLRSDATSRLAPALRRIALQQQDELWMNALEKFSDNYVSSWDEDELRSDPRRWLAVQDAITALLGIFELRRSRIPRDESLRRIHVLLCIFYGKALWYAGEVTAERAAEADEWLAAAAQACLPQDDEDAAAESNGWIESWALLRRAEIWSTLDPQRSHRYLDGLESKAIDDDDWDIRVGIVMLIGDMRWRSGVASSAFDAYSRALLISYAYNVRQEAKRRTPNLYTKALYASTIRRVQERAQALWEAGEFDVLETALDNMRQVFAPYWDRVRDRVDQTLTPESALPVPPPDADEVSSLESEYVQDLEHLALRREDMLYQPTDQPHSGDD